MCDEQISREDKEVQDSLKDFQDTLSKIPSPEPCCSNQNVGTPRVCKKRRCSPAHTCIHEVGRYYWKYTASKTPHSKVPQSTDLSKGPSDVPSTEPLQSDALST